MDNVLSIFPGLVEGIISAGSGQARTRANLYGAFLYFIQIGQMYNSIVKEGMMVWLELKFRCFYLPCTKDID